MLFVFYLKILREFTLIFHLDSQLYLKVKGSWIYSKLGVIYMSELKRFGVSIEEELLNEFDDINQGIYESRSEAIRDLIRQSIIDAENEDEESEVVGTLTIIYNHHKKGLTDKMNQLQHDYHCLFKSNLHLHLDAEFCLEVIVVEGPYAKLKEISSRIIALKGVKQGRLTVTNIEGVKMENEK